ncbi:MAG: VTT domain-containing protein [Planctomycetaceae bacterium]|nr:VTT domain-containing protein [Planctomycetaceae bacterium]
MHESHEPAASQPPRGSEVGQPRPRDLRLIASGVLGLLWITFPPLAGIYILVELRDIATFLEADLRHGFWAYVAVFMITAGLGLLPTYSQAFLGGWVFGMQWGLTGAIMGFTGGAAIGYLFSRLVTGRSVDSWIDRHPRGRVIRDALARGSIGRTFLVIALIRLPPNSPFAITNYALGATRVPFWLAMAATPLGMLPRTAVVCFLASAARSSGAVDILSVYESAPKWAFWSGIAASVLVIFIIGRMAERALTQLSAPASGANQGAAS